MSITDAYSITNSQYERKTHVKLSSQIWDFWRYYIRNTGLKIMRFHGLLVKNWSNSSARDFSFLRLALYLPSMLTPRKVPEEIQRKLIHGLAMMMPITSSEAERGFSQLKLVSTLARSVLTIINVSFLLLVGINSTLSFRGSNSQSHGLVEAASPCNL